MLADFSGFVLISFNTFGYQSSSSFIHNFEFRTRTQETQETQETKQTKNEQNHIQVQSHIQASSRPRNAPPICLDIAMSHRNIIFCHHDLSSQGERVSLDLGPNIVTWGRVRKNGNEFIKHCQPEEKNIRCAQFVDEKNQAAVPATDAHVNENGTLVINSFQSSDVGEYFSPDELERKASSAFSSRDLMFACRDLAFDIKITSIVLFVPMLTKRQY
ncbi:hypothetical protein Y032_0834g2592 [Ancylostoma ceylanicum]|uniref:Uncharacterized protein n=1 Tax=Ancylostoma ceylanicum TaxID=53326 RepID=A0A016WB54_9BILA|nr:hypothetical protein Y032_0834g2592 [Ancylostoma ceylanicum]